MKGEFNKDIESLKKKKKKDPDGNPGNKKLLKSNKKYSCKPLLQTGLSGRHNFRT
jgi:hypothetical protein